MDKTAEYRGAGMAEKFIAKEVLGIWYLVFSFVSKMRTLPAALT
jgi:hypothetical protein